MSDATTTRNEDLLAVWKRWMGPVIVVAAIVPIAVSLTPRGKSDPVEWIDIASWLVFLADFVVHLRLRRGYLRSRVGVFDLVIVLLTFPWYLLAGVDAGRLLGLARLGRLMRVFVVSAHSRRLHQLGRRLGEAALYSAALIMVGAIVVRAVEPPASGFDTFGDALWWGLVTFTTVGYGDLYPTTGTGRLAAALLMLGGVALIGSLAASLGTFLQRSEAAESDDTDQAASEPRAATTDEVLAEVRALRAEVASLRQQLARPTDDAATITPNP